MSRPLLAILAISLLPGLAFAGGGLSTPRVGGLGPHSPTEGDVSSIYWNPAAITLLSEKLRLVLDVTYTSARGTVQRFVGPNGQPPDETTTGLEPVPLQIDLPVPFLGAVYKINSKLSAGLAIMAPIGRAGDFIGDCRNQDAVTITNCEQTSSVRYQTTHSVLQSIYLTPTVAYAISPKISVGAGFDLIYSMFSSDAAVDTLGTEDPNNQAFVHIGSVIADGKDADGVSTDDDGDGAALLDTKPLTGFSPAGNVGVYYAPNDRFSFGLSYSSRTKVDVKGRAVAQLSSNGVVVLKPQEGNAEVSYMLPDTLNAGAKVQLTPRFDVDAWYQFMNYHLHDKIDVNLTDFNAGPLNREPDPTEDLPGTALARQFQDNSAVNLGINYRTLDRRGRVGAAVMYEGSAIPTVAQTSASIDGRKLDFMGYLEYLPTNKLRVVLGFSFIKGLAPTDNRDDSIFKGAFHNDKDNGYDCATGNDPATGLCYPVGNGVYQVGIGRVGLTLGYSF